MAEQQTRNTYDLFLENRSNYSNVVTKTLSLDTELDLNTLVTVPIKGYNPDTVVALGSYIPYHTINTPNAVYYISIDPDKKSPQYLCLCRIMDDANGKPELKIIKFADPNFELNSLIQKKGHTLLNPYYEFCTDYYIFGDKTYLIIGGKNINPFIVSFEEVLAKLLNGKLMFDCTSLLLNNKTIANNFDISLVKGTPLTAGVYQIVIYKTTNNIITSEDYCSRDIPICEFTSHRRDVAGEPYTNFRTTTNIILQNIIPQVKDPISGLGVPDPVNAAIKYKILIKQLKAVRNSSSFVEEAFETNYYLSQEQTINKVTISDEFLSRCQPINQSDIDLKNNIKYLNKFCIHQRKMIAQLNSDSDVNHKLLQQIANSIPIKLKLVNPLGTNQKKTELLAGSASINPVFAFNNRSFKPNEVYALYLGVKLRGLDLSWYHIPGKQAGVGSAYRMIVNPKGVTIPYQNNTTTSLPDSFKITDKRLYNGALVEITNLPTSVGVGGWRTTYKSYYTGDGKEAYGFELKGVRTFNIDNNSAHITYMEIFLDIDGFNRENGVEDIKDLTYKVTINACMPLYDSTTKTVLDESTNPMSQSPYPDELCYYQSDEKYNLSDESYGLSIKGHKVIEQDQPIRHHRIPSLSHLSTTHPDDFNFLHSRESNQPQPIPSIWLEADLNQNDVLTALRNIPDLEYFVFGHAEKNNTNSRNLGSTPVQLKNRNNQAVLYRNDTSYAMAGHYINGKTSLYVPNPTYEYDDNGVKLDSLVDDETHNEGRMLLKSRACVFGINQGVTHFADNVVAGRNSEPIGSIKAKLTAFNKNWPNQFSNFIERADDYFKLPTLGDVIARINRQRRVDATTPTDLILSLSEWQSKPSDSINAIEFSYLGRDTDDALVGKRLDGINDSTMDWGERVAQPTKAPFSELRFKRYQPNKYINVAIEGNIVGINNIAVTQYFPGDTVVNDIAPVGRIFNTTNDLTPLINLMRIDDTYIADMLSFNKFIHANYHSENVVLCSDKFTSEHSTFEFKYGDCVHSYRTFNKYIPFSDDNLVSLHSCCIAPAMDGRSDKKEDIGSTVDNPPSPTSPVVGLDYFTASNNLIYKPLTTTARFEHLTEKKDNELVTGNCLTIANKGYIGEQKYVTNVYMHNQVDGVAPNHSVEFGPVMPFLFFRVKDSTKVPQDMSFTPNRQGVVGQRTLFMNLQNKAPGVGRQATINILRQAVSTDTSPITLLRDQWVKCIFATNINTTKTAPSQTFLVKDSTTYLSGGYCICDIPTARESGPGTSESVISTYWFPKNNSYAHGFSYWVHINKPIVCEYPVIDQTNHNWDGAVAGEFHLTNDATKSDYNGVQAGFAPHYKNAVYQVFSKKHISSKLIFDMSLNLADIKASELNKLYVSKTVSSEKDLSELFSFQLQNYISLPNTSFGLTKLLSYRNNLYVFCKNNSFVIEQQQTLNTSVDNLINVSQLDLQSVVPKELMYDEVGGIGLDIPYNNMITPFGICHYDKTSKSLYVIDNNLRELSNKGIREFLKNRLESTHKVVFHTNEYNDKLYATFIHNDFVKSDAVDVSKNFTLSFYLSSDNITCFSFHKFKPYFVMRDKKRRFMLNDRLNFVYELTSKNHYGLTNPDFRTNN